MRLLLVPCLACAAALCATPETPSQGDLSGVSLEELLNVQVTSASKKEQKLSRTGAAIFVLNSEEIRRSGATNIPDLLRLVPGLDVGRIDAHTWAISIRGQNHRFTNKVLVLIDGRSVYTPLTSGVNWDQQDVPVEDIERIEVLRGPGGTVWGANAVNGVINIRTRSAQNTERGLITASGGGQDQHGLLQYGAKLGSGAYRVFGNYGNAGSSSFAPQSGFTGRAADGYRTIHGGFRSDWNISPRDGLTVQGDVLDLNAGQTVFTVFSNNLPRQGTVNDKVGAHASDVLGRWNRAFADGSEMSLQMYYDRYSRLEAGLREARNTGDFDFHHHFRAGDRHDIVWGLGYRLTADHITPGYGTSYTPERRTDSLTSTFFQDEIQLSESLFVTAGSKFEHNGYTGFEYEPSTQIVWSPTARQELWASAARAIRQPSRSDVDVHADLGAVPFGGGAVAILRLSGKPYKQAEHVYDYEVGYRAQAASRLSLDLSTFFTVYHGLDTVEPGAPTITAGPVPQVILPLTLDGLAHGRTLGGEVFANVNVTRHWRVSPGYSLIHLSIERDAGSLDTAARSLVDNTPQQQFQVRSSATLPHGFEWDTAIAYVGKLRKDGGASEGIPAYTRLDVRVGKRLGESTELSIVGQNLLNGRHAEFQDSYGKLNTVVQRNVFARIAWTF